MATVSKKLGQYESLGKVKSKSGIPFIWTWKVDPSAIMREVVEDYIKSQRKKLNDMVSNNFDLEDGSFQKFEFQYIPERAEYVGEKETTYRMNTTVSALYIKEKSLIFFSTAYRFEIKNGMFLNGEVRMFGGRDNDMEEIYFNKINSVKTSHDESDLIYLTGGILGFFQKKEARLIAKDGIIIRAGENLELFAEERQAKELKEATKLINSKVQETNS